MASQGRTAREGLLAVRIRAFIRSFARMYPPMPCKGAGVTERLLRVRNRSRINSIVSYLATALAHMRLLPSVNSVVHCQS